MAECWFSKLPGATPCQGRLVKCHLIPGSLMRRELPKAQATKYYRKASTWVWGCGGASGLGGHHGELDHNRTLKIPRALLPTETEAVARKLGLDWWLDREYGPLP